MLANVDAELAGGVAAGLGMAVPEPLPRRSRDAPKPEVTSVAGAVAVRAAGRRQHPHAARRASWSPTASTARRRARCTRALAGARRGAALRRARGWARCRRADGDAIEVEVTLETMPSVLFDAVACRAARRRQDARQRGSGPEFIKDQYRHCKPILALGAGAALVENAGVPRCCRRGSPIPAADRQGREATKPLAAVRRGHRQAPPPRARDGSAGGVRRPGRTRIRGHSSALGSSR